MFLAKLPFKKRKKKSDFKNPCKVEGKRKLDSLLFFDTFSAVNQGGKTVKVIDDIIWPKDGAVKTKDKRNDLIGKERFHLLIFAALKLTNFALVFILDW